MAGSNSLMALRRFEFSGSDFNESDLVTGCDWLRVDDSTKASSTSIIHSNFSMNVVAFALWKVRSLEFDPPCLRHALKNSGFIQSGSLAQLVEQRTLNP